jgi:hypothetical protein
MVKMVLGTMLNTHELAALWLKASCAKRVLARAWILILIRCLKALPCEALHRGQYVVWALIATICSCVTQADCLRKGLLLMSVSITLPLVLHLSFTLLIAYLRARIDPAFSGTASLNAPRATVTATRMEGRLDILASGTQTSRVRERCAALECRRAQAIEGRRFEAVAVKDVSSRSGLLRLPGRFI